MEAKIEKVTPEKAELWLGQNVHNRALRPRHVDRLAGIILRDEWVLNGDSIKFNDDVLLDGQHRLAAIIKADRPVQSLVVRGLSRTAQDTVDQGARRSLADVLRLRGIPNAAALAGILGHLYRESINGPRSAEAPTVHQALALLAENPGVVDSIPTGSRCNAILRIPGSLGAFLHYRFTSIDADDAADFFEKLLRGTGLAETDAVYHLRRALEQNAIAKRRLSRVEVHALIIKAWNHYRHGNEIRNLRWRSGGAQREAFPEAE